MQNLRFIGAGSLGGVDFHHIKAGLELSGVLDQINLSGGAQLFLLPPVHSGPRPAVSVIFPQLDLHKAQIGPVLRDQVQLPKPALPVGLNDLKALPPQEAGRLLLTPAAQLAALPAAHWPLSSRPSEGRAARFKKLRRWMGLSPKVKGQSDLKK